MNLNFIKLNLLNKSQKPVLLWLWRAGFAGILLTLILLIILWSGLPPVIPFFYSLPWGEEQLAAPLSLIFFLLGSLLLFCLNTILSLFLERVNSYIAQVLFVSTISLCLISIYTIIRILILIS